MAFFAKPLSNPGAEAWVTAIRQRAGLDVFQPGAGVRGVIRRLRAGGTVAMLADQDARRDGVFVPFFGRPASTPAGPAWLALATRAPMVFCTCARAADGRLELRMLRAIEPEGDADDAQAVRALTAQHTALLEAAVRERPAQWFWLHKRWKTLEQTAQARED
jgi:KDO2-lipid IV(A) lauroyltransferase